MSSLNNKSVFIGHVGNDPEIISTPTGKRKATFSVATSEVYKDKNGEKKTVTDWHNIVAWGKLAEIIEKYVKKGAEVMVECKHKTESYEDKEKVKKYFSYFLASEIRFLGAKTKELSEAQEAMPVKDGDWDDLPY